MSDQVPFGQPPGIDTYRRQKWSVFARRHCQFPGCYRIIPDRKRAGYCDEHRPLWERERRRLAERARRMSRAIREGRSPRPRSHLKWGWLFK